MKQFVCKPTIHMFPTCKDFLAGFDIGEDDLVLSNAYIFKPFFDGLDCRAKALFLEDYGQGEPSDTMVDALLAAASRYDFRRIIAIGGGSVIDVAKVLAVAPAGSDTSAVFDCKELKQEKELIILPTTCGTGSEVTNISIINRTRIGTKMGLASEKMFADAAVLVPELLSSLPFGVFATSSIDALVHAVESSLSPKATAYTKLFGYKAIEMIIRSYQKLVKEGREVLGGLMEDFLIASNYAGLAFGTAGCAAVHAMSYPLGGTYHVPHGESNYAMFTGVLKNYMEIKQDGEIAVMNGYLADLLGCGVGEVYDKLEELLNQVLPKKALHEYGVTVQDLDTFTEAVMTTQGRLMGNNFVPLDAERVRKIYGELY